MPIDERRRDDIAAAVAAYDRANPKARLPRTAALLLAAMFPSEDVCPKSQDDIPAEGFSRDSMPGFLRRLEKAGFITRERKSAPVKDLFRMQLPPLQR